MFEKIEELIHKETSMEKTLDHAQRINALERRYCYKNYHKSAKYCAKALRKLGLSEVELIHHPADGTTTFMDCIMPMAWDVREARLEIVRPKHAKHRVLADWEEDPFCIAQWSEGTGPRGVEAEVVAEEMMIAGANVRGKIVFNSTEHHPRDIKQEVARRGGIGVISDWTAQDNAPRDGRYWHNSWSQTTGPWYGGIKEDKESPIWLFSLSPKMGGQLRALMKRERKGVKLRAVVRTRLYNGTIPSITGIIPGSSRKREQVLLIAHLFEPMPSDNALGAAGVLEIVRVIQSLTRGGMLPPPARDIRVHFGMEMHGLAAFLESRPEVRVQTVGAINIDGIGADLKSTGIPARVGLNHDAAASITDTLFKTIVSDCTARYSPWLAWQTFADDSDDNFISDPTIGVPVNRYFTFDSKYHHTSLDDFSFVNPEILRLSLTICGSHIYALSTAGQVETLWLATRAASEARSRMDATVDNMLGVDRRATSAYCLPKLDKVRQRLESIEQIERGRLAGCKSLAGARSNRSRSYLTNLDRDISSASKKAAIRATRIINATRTDKESAEQVKLEPSNEVLQAENMIPKRVRRGPMVYFHRIPRERHRKLPLYGTRSALAWTDGKRSILQIARLLEDERGGRPTQLRQLLAIFRLLTKYGYMRLAYRMRLSGSDVKRALRRVGIKRNDIVFMHSSLSHCGPIDGGAKAVINALMGILSPQGTLVLPTHYNSGVIAVTECGVKHSYPRNPLHIPVPWDPKKSPAETGAIPDAFRQRRDVIRSQHPTHSVAAWGRYAKEIIEGHGPGTHCCGREGPHGKMVDMKGKFLYFGCTLNAATFLHALEDWAGLGYMPIAEVLMRKGKKVEKVTSLHYPEGCRSFYTGPPNKVTRKMDEMKIKVDHTALGLSELKLVAARDFHRISSAFETEPDLLLCDRTRCPFCSWARKKIKATRRK